MTPATTSALPALAGRRSVRVVARSLFALGYCGWSPGQLEGEIRDTVGAKPAEAIQDILRNAHRPDAGSWAIVISTVVLIAGASGVFNELQTALNAIWEVKAKEGRGILDIIKDRFLSFTLVIGTGFLLLVSLLVSAVLEAAMEYFGGWFRHPLTVSLVGMGVSFAVIGTLFAMMFKLIPDAKTRWRDVWLGASITSLLFTIGKWLIGLYLGHSALASSYGAAGSFVVLLLWLYYSCQIVLMGAEITHAYAHMSGRDPVPKEYAISLEKESIPEPAHAGEPRDGSRGRS